MPAPSRNERDMCWSSRDNFYSCLENNNEDESKCLSEKSLYGSCCPKEWVRYFNKQRNRSLWKEKYQKGLIPGTTTNARKEKDSQSKEDKPSWYNLVISTMYSLMLFDIKYSNFSLLFWDLYKQKQDICYDSFLNNFIAESKYHWDRISIEDMLKINLKKNKVSMPNIYFCFCGVLLSMHKVSS